MIYFEDLAVGQIERFGNYPVTREEVIDFASRYDPQPFHLEDDAAGANPVFGRISASAIHTMAMSARMTVDRWNAIGFSPTAGLGMEEMRVTNPVYPGDTLHLVTEIKALRRSASWPDNGIVKTLVQTLNQDDQLVLHYTAVVLLKAREPAA